MFAKINSLGLHGLDGFKVDVEIDINRGKPQFDIVGLADTVVKESRERIKSALRACGINFPVASVMVNLAPADTKKIGSVYDLPIFMAVLSALRIITNSRTKDCAFIGELSLNGDVRGITGVLPMMILAHELGIKSVFVPYDNANEASVIDDVTVYGVKNCDELIKHFSGEKPIPPYKRYIPPESEYSFPYDFADVKGQMLAKRALEIASAGGHNALLSGAPGCGKSMLAQRLPSILPPLSFEESLEATKIHSVSGLLTPEQPIVTVRPFRSPHHTISTAGLAGGGSEPKPGEVSLAHNGVLFLDEMPEFDRTSLELLRQPLETGKITISRASGTVTYPCSFMLIGAMNPCPCGYYGHPSRPCTCTDKVRLRYQGKISGPMLDRFDLYINLAPPEYRDLSSDRKEEPSAEIRKRIIAARNIQTERFKGTPITCNAQITDDKLNEYCVMDNGVKEYLGKMFEVMKLSARAYTRILRVSRTIADLAGSSIICKNHVAEAVQYRKIEEK